MLWQADRASALARSLSVDRVDRRATSVSVSFNVVVVFHVILLIVVVIVVVVAVVVVVVRMMRQLSGHGIGVTAYFANANVGLGRLIG